MIIKICEVCSNSFETKNITRKCCNASCGSKLKYKNRPELIDQQSKIGRKTMKYLNSSGLAYRMPKDTHTAEFKRKLIERSKLPKSEKTKELIKQNHWSKDPEKKKVTVEKILKTRSTNPSFNSYERRHILANLVATDPEKYTKNKFYKRGRVLNTTTNKEEYYASGFEKSIMEDFNSNNKIKEWTKNHGIIIHYNFNCKEYKYYPDFLVTYNTGRIELIEAKGRLYDVEKIKAKIKFAKLYCKQSNIKFKMIFQNKNDAKKF